MTPKANKQMSHGHYTYLWVVWPFLNLCLDNSANRWPFNSSHNSNCVKSDCSLYAAIMRQITGHNHVNNWKLTLRENSSLARRFSTPIRDYTMCLLIQLTCDQKLLDSRSRFKLKLRATKWIMEVSFYFFFCLLSLFIQIYLVGLRCLARLQQQQGQHLDRFRLRTKQTGSDSLKEAAPWFSLSSNHGISGESGKQSHQRQSWCLGLPF